MHLFLIIWHWHKQYSTVCTVQNLQGNLSPLYHVYIHMHRCFNCLAFHPLYALIYLSQYPVFLAHSAVSCISCYSSFLCVLYTKPAAPVSCIMCQLLQPKIMHPKSVFLANFHVSCIHSQLSNILILGYILLFPSFSRLLPLYPLDYSTTVPVYPVSLTSFLSFKFP